MSPKLTRATLAPLLKGVREIYVSACAGEIAELPGMLDASAGAATVTGIFSPLVNSQSYANAETGRRCRTFFLNHALRRDLQFGLVDFCPWSYGRIHRWIRQPALFDAAIVVVAPPDASGHCSFGTQADFIPDFYRQVGRLIGVVNPNMPRTRGAQGIHLSEFDALFEHDAALLEYGDEDGAPDPVGDAIAANAARLVTDGATIQLGIGRLPRAIAAALRDRRNLRIHSGLIDDAVITLEDCGALDRSTTVVSGVAIGSEALYRRLVDSARFSFQPVSRTHDRAAIASSAHFIALNAAIQVDLFGQVNSEVSNGRFIASPGGLPDFLRGAQESLNGKAVISVRASGGRRGQCGIVARFAEPYLITSARVDADIVVSEFGIAEIGNLSMDRRAEALIGIAAPDQRASLQVAWDAMRAAGIAWNNGGREAT